MGERERERERESEGEREREGEKERGGEFKLNTMILQKSFYQIKSVQMKYAILIIVSARIRIKVNCLLS